MEQQAQLNAASISGPDTAASASTAELQRRAKARVDQLVALIIHAAVYLIVNTALQAMPELAELAAWSPFPDFTLRFWTLCLLAHGLLVVPSFFMAPWYEQLIAREMRRLAPRS
ncbi:2TM domain-containing protein [Paucibacter sp. APW11]|uniref:2TM domain-containing protein n=1 Tax=Roseateles aquae TaxID=3077235 RepID=A0ABU3P9M2_9BURK|nr:2TM domain-containing protein [Paucibacter sp. APW11]MDT8999274.1 2TM domain-containing protein [Paucibacter sp. APW11]